VVERASRVSAERRDENMKDEDWPVWLQILIVAAMASLIYLFAAYTGFKGNPDMLTPPESLYTPHDR